MEQVELFDKVFWPISYISLGIYIIAFGYGLATRGRKKDQKLCHKIEDISLIVCLVSLLIGYLVIVIG